MAAVDRSAPTGPSLGAASPLIGGIAPWTSFAAQAREQVPELREPMAPRTYEQMLNDAQVWGLYSGAVLPIEDYAWWVDPNGNPAGRTQALADDLGLPIGPPDTRTDEVERVSLPDEFDFGDMLHEALLGPVFGRYYFEWTGEIRDGMWRLTGMVPLHPSTVSQIKSDRQGRLEYVVQQGGSTYTLMGETLYAGTPPKIPPQRLVPFVFWPDATRKWVGRSLLRPLYRNWLCKDVLIRVDVTNHERAGGVPYIETDERYQGVDLNDLQRLASEFRVDGEGGAALPPGAVLKLARAGGTNVIDSVRWHDEQMAKVWAEMVRELGHTATGSRALGETFVDLEALMRRALAGWAAETINRWVCGRWWLWNFGERNPPLVRFTPPAIEAAEPPPGQLAAPMPAATPLETADTGGGASPPDPPVAAAPGASPQPRGARAAPHSVAAAVEPRPMAEARSRVPDRQLRRAPTVVEVAAAVDFAAMDTLHATAADRLDSLFLTSWLPAQMAAASDSIVYTRRGTARQRLTAADMAKVTVPTEGADALAEVLLEVAQHGAQEAIAELAAQGLTLDAPAADELRAAVVDHANAVAQQTADGLRLAVTRKAVQLAGSGMTPAELATAVVDYVNGLTHAWERDQLAGAVQQAVNHGRLHVFDRASGVRTTTAYASELLDAVTCDACQSIDGTEYPSVDAARADYPSGGFRDCRGGSRCRGTVVAVLSDETPHGSVTFGG